MKKPLFILILLIAIIPSTSKASLAVFRKSDGQMMSWSRYNDFLNCDCDRAGYIGTQILIDLGREQEVDRRTEKYSTTTASVVLKTPEELAAYDARELEINHKTSSLEKTLSDSQFKEAVNPLGNSLEKVLQLNGVTFKWKGSGDSDTGLIAQDVQQIIPEAVTEDPDGIHYINYQKLVPYLIESIKDLSGRLSVSATSTASTTPSTSAGPTNAWAVDQSSGQVNVSFFGNVNLQGNYLQDVGRITGMFGKWNIDGEGNLAAKSVTTDALTVKGTSIFGSADSPQGVVLFDSATKQPYCVSINNGALISVAGACDAGSSSGSGETGTTTNP